MDYGELWTSAHPWVHLGSITRTDPRSIAARPRRSRPRPVAPSCTLRRRDRQGCPATATGTPTRKRPAQVATATACPLEVRAHRRDIGTDWSGHD